MLEFFRHLFDSDFMPHGHCYLWRPDVLWLHVLSDSLIAISYLSIPISLAVFVRKRGDIVFEWMFVMFAAFIFACGATHALEVLTVWHPIYRLTGIVKAIAGIVSATTAIALWRLMPRMLALPSPAQLRLANSRLESEILERERAEEAVRGSRDQLEERVSARTIDLARANEELRASQRLIKAILDNSPTIMQISDVEGRYLLVNRRFESLMRMPSHRALGKTPQELFSPAIAEALSDGGKEAFETAEPVQREKEIQMEDGPRTYMSVKFPLLDDDGKQYAVCGSAYDITDRKHTEVELLKAREEVERASAAKSDFLSRISHELRTPLNAILGFAQVLDMEEPTPKQRPSLEQILRGGRHLLVLINEVLDLSRVEAGKMTISPEPVAAWPMLVECMNLMRPVATERAIQVTFDATTTIRDAYVLADAQRLKQVLLNLLSNAVKYNRDHGTVTISCEATTENYVRLTVRDTGWGIAAADQARIFDAFERLKAERAGIEGTGLGLALAKQLVELMGGRIGVDSEPGSGSAFWIELPRTEATASNSPLSVAPPVADMAAQAMKTILYVEDNLPNLNLFERIFEHRPSIKVLAAMQGRLGLELIREHRPDLILLDLHLPDIHGSEVLRRLRADSGTRHIPVVVISADATQGEISRLLAAGARAYLTKPFDVPELLQVVDDLLNDAHHTSN